MRYYTEAELYKMHELGKKGFTFKESHTFLLKDRETVQDTNLRHIFESTYTHFNITPDEMRSSSRKRHLASARKAFCFLAKDFSGASLTSIGLYIDRQHPCVLHSIKKVRDFIDIEDSSTIHDLNAITLIYHNKKQKDESESRIEEKANETI